MALHVQPAGPRELAEVLGTGAPHPRRLAPTGITPLEPSSPSARGKTIGVGYSGRAGRGVQALTHKSR